MRTVRVGEDGKNEHRRSAYVQKVHSVGVGDRVSLRSSYSLLRTESVLFFAKRNECVYYVITKVSLRVHRVLCHDLF